MAVAFDAASESHTGTTGSQSEASFSWSHGGASSGVKGVVVFTMNTSTTADDDTAVTYGGVSMAAVTGGLAVDSIAETGNCKAWFLGSSVPQGTQTIVVTRVNNAGIHYAVAATVLASGDTAVTGVLLEEGDQALAEENIDDGSPGSNSVRFAGVHSGAANITAALLPGASSTLLGAIDFGANVAMAVRETTAGQGARPVGFVAAIDDVAAVYLAVKESAGPATQNLTGALFTKAPTFFTGAITATYNLTGTLFAKAPTFPTGVVTAGVVTLTGSLFTKAPTFPTGAVSLTSGPQTLTGTLFVKAPTFPQGVVTTGPVSLTGVLFTKAPTFFTGTVTAGAYPLTGVLFTKVPTFFTGTIGQSGTLFGNLFVKAPTFFIGSFVQGGPSFWTPNPAAYVGVTRYGPSPWGAELSGQRFEKAPTFPVGSVT